MENKETIVPINGKKLKGLVKNGSIASGIHQRQQRYYWKGFRDGIFTAVVIAMVFILLDLLLK